MGWEYTALGPIEVRRDGERLDLGGPRQRRLLAVLLVHHRDGISDDRLVDAVLGDGQVQRPRAALRTYVTRLRKSLLDADATLVRRTPVGYQLDLATATFDVTRFEQLADQGRRLLQQERPADASAAFTDARALWRAHPYEEFADEAWAADEVHRLEQAMESVREQHIDARLLSENVGEVVSDLHRAIAADPYREGLVRRLMVALYLDGHPQEALDAFTEYRSRAAGELGIDPGPGLVDLQRRILARDPDLDVRDATGRTLRGYRLQARLGSGRNGTVYAARVPGVDREYAIRVYDDHVADDPSVIRSFESHARALAVLDAPSLVPVYDAWREPGLAALVMKRMPGGTLQDRMDEGELTPADAATVIERVGTALLALNGRGLVHGRVRPSSVLFDGRGNGYLAEIDPVRSDSRADDAGDFQRLVAACLGSAQAPEPGWLADLGSTSPDDVEASVAEVFRQLRAEHPRPVNPYVGLRAFEEADADRFYGRDALIDRMHERLLAEGSAGRLLLVVGGSGSGKSSTVRAGLVPRLRSEVDPTWTVTSMVPGAQPWRNLEEALSRVSPAEVDPSVTLAAGQRALSAATEAVAPSGGRVLLVIDQFEELFTVSPRAERERLLDQIADAVTVPGGRLHAVLTLRADHLDRPLDHPRFGTLASEATLTVPSMTPDELEQAVTGPAEQMSIEPGLAAALVSAVGDQSAALPSLQFTLHELAERGGSTLRWSDLDALGGVDGAIASRAETLFVDMDPDDQALMHRVFEHLVAVTATSDPSRRRASRAELVALDARPGHVDRLLETWITARLLATDHRPDTREPTVDVAHEAVLRAWPRLRGWIDADRERLLAMTRLEQEAQTWVDLDRDPGALLRGARLESALDITGHAEQHVTNQVREFVVAGTAERDQAAQAAAEAAEQRARANRRLRNQRMLLAAALVVAVLVGAVAINQGTRAARSAGEAEARAQIASAGLVAASDEARGSDWTLSLLLAAEAYQLLDSPDTQRQLVSTLTNPLPVPTTLHEAEHPYSAMEIDAQTGLIAAKSPDGPVDLVDPATGELVADDLPAGPLLSGALDISHDLVAASGFDGDVGKTLVYRVGSADPVADIPTTIASAGTAFSPDGEYLALAQARGITEIYDTNDWSVARVLSTGPVESGEEFAGTVERVAWSPDGQRVYTGDGEGTVFAFDLDGEPSGRAPVQPTVSIALGGEGLEAGVNEIIPIPGQDRLLVAQWSIQAHILDAADLSILEGPFLEGGSASVAPDGESMVLRNEVRSLSVWEVNEPVLDATLGASVTDSAFDAEGALYTVGTDGRLTTWETRRPIPGTEPVPGVITEMPTLSPDQQMVAMTTPGQGIFLYDLATYEPVSQLDLGDPQQVNLLGVAFLPGRDRVVASWCPDTPWDLFEACEAVVAAFDITSGDLVLGPVEHGSVIGYAVPSVAAIPAVDQVVTTEAGGLLTLRDPDTLEPVATIDDVLGSPLSDRAYPSVSADGTLLSVSIWPGDRVAVWDFGSGEPTLLHTGDLSGISNITPGDRVLAANGGQVRAIDARTGEPIHEESFDRYALWPTFTSDGRLMATFDVSGAATLWDAETLDPIAGPIYVGGWGAMLHPDGSHLLLDGRDQSYRFPLEPEAWLDLACEAAGRNMTPEEWERYFPDEPYHETCPTVQAATPH